MNIFFGRSIITSGFDLSTARCALVERKQAYDGRSISDYHIVDVDSIKCNVYAAKTSMENSDGVACGIYIDPIIFPPITLHRFDGALIYFDYQSSMFNRPAFIYISNYDSPPLYVIDKRIHIKFKDNLISYYY